MEEMEKFNQLQFSVTIYTTIYILLTFYILLTTYYEINQFIKYINQINLVYFINQS